MLGAGDIVKGITKKAVHLEMCFYSSERSKCVQQFNSSASTVENKSNLSLSKPCVPNYSVWLFTHIIFNPIIFMRKEFFFPHCISKETSLEI